MFHDEFDQRCEIRDIAHGALERHVGIPVADLLSPTPVRTWGHPADLKFHRALRSRAEFESKQIGPVPWREDANGAVLLDDPHQRREIANGDRERLAVALARGPTARAIDLERHVLTFTPAV